MKNFIDKKVFGERLKHLMKNYNETTYSLGQLFNLSPPTISRYTRGEMIPKMTTITALAKYFNVNPKWLTGEQEDIFEDNILEDNLSLTNIDVFKSIKYRLPLFSNQKKEEKIKVPIQYLTNWGAVIGYEVQDNSMSPEIQKGDDVIIKLTSELDPSKLVALHVNQEDLIIRKAILDDKYLILQPSNFNYNAQVFNLKKDNVQVIGNVVFVKRVIEKLL